jgi:hypothetical protein
MWVKRFDQEKLAWTKKPSNDVIETAKKVSSWLNICYSGFSDAIRID